MTAETQHEKHKHHFVALVNTSLLILLLLSLLLNFNHYEKVLFTKYLLITNINMSRSHVKVFPVGLVLAV